MNGSFNNSLIPDEELRQQRGLNLTPMVDFLFLILAIFAVIAVTHTLLYDNDIDIVKMESRTPPPSLADSSYGSTVLLSIDFQGNYKWVSEFNEFRIEGVEAIIQELHKQQALGLLPKESSRIKVLLQIDQKAEWHHVAKAVFALKEAGFPISPVYSEYSP